MSLLPQSRDAALAIRHLLQAQRYRGGGELLLAAGGVAAISATLSARALFPGAASPWITIGGLATGALLLVAAAWHRARFTIPPPASETAPAPSVIRGPLAFGAPDGAVFQRLAREEETRRLVGLVLDDQLPVVLLTGASGAGKTSLLRAGLEYTLAHAVPGGAPVTAYWDATSRVPLESLAHALRARLTPATRDAGASLRWGAYPPAVRELSGVGEGPPLVVMIDHAEQLSPQEHPEIFAILEESATALAPHHVTWVVAFRKEWMGTWLDFQDTVPDFLPVRVSLRAFRDEEALAVMATLAGEAGIVVEQEVVRRIVRAIGQNGVVSPVDVGIAMFVLAELGGNGAEIDAALYQAGGEDAGLIARYIRGKVTACCREDEIEPVFLGLLQLIDPEMEGRRPDGATVEQLAAAASLPARRMEAVAEYLASPRARLLERTSREPRRFRLGHERLIPALQHLTRVKTAQAAEAERRFDERFRLWAREPSFRLLLPAREIRQVARYRDQFRWRGDRAAKLRYLQRSRRARHLLLGGGGAAAVGVAGGSFLLREALVAERHRDEFRQLGLPADLYDRLGGLDTLMVGGVDFRGYDWLPDHLRGLRLDFRPGSRALLPKAFPGSLRSLMLALSHTGASALPRLPDSLRVLRVDASGTRLEELPPLPARLRELELLLCRTRVSELPRWPRRLEQLSVFACESGVTRMPPLPPTVRKLTVGLDAGLNELPRLPAGLVALTVVMENGKPVPVPAVEPPPSLRSLTLIVRNPAELRLPAFPPQLRSLTLMLAQSGVKEVPALPADLDSLMLVLDPPQAEQLLRRPLPGRLRHLLLNVSGPMALDSLPLPPTLQSLGLILRDTTITSLPPLPGGVESLTIDPTGTRIRDLAGVPDRLRRLDLQQRGQHVQLPNGASGIAYDHILTPLPRLGPKVRSLDLDLTNLGSGLGSIPADFFPAEVDTLRLGFANTWVPALPRLPARIDHLALNLHGTALGLPHVQRARHYALVITNTAIRELRPLPEGLVRLDLQLARGQITTLAPVPASVTTLWLDYQ